MIKRSAGWSGAQREVPSFDSLFEARGYAWCLVFFVSAKIDRIFEARGYAWSLVHFVDLRNLLERDHQIQLSSLMHCLHFLYASSWKSSISDFRSHSGSFSFARSNAVLPAYANGTCRRELGAGRSGARPHSSRKAHTLSFMVLSALLSSRNFRTWGLPPFNSAAQ